MNTTTAHVSIPKLGEHVNGDAVVVRNTSPDGCLFAVIDGLGHGPAAAEASRAAVSCLARAELQAPLLTHMKTLHAELRGTRGAAATVCIVRDRQLEACAVGNVQLSAAAADVPLVLSSGVLGLRVAKFRVCEASIDRGARIAMFSDGISSKFRLDDCRHLSAQAACELTIERFRKREDDATILIVDLEP